MSVALVSGAVTGTAYAGTTEQGPGRPGRGLADPTGPDAAHGLQEFTTSGSFVPPSGVSTIFIQVWGAGGGGAGGSADGGRGQGGGAGGFARCAVHVRPGEAHLVVVAGGGAGGATGAPGDNAGLTYMTATSDTALAVAWGGVGGADPASPGAGGVGACESTGTDGLTRQGAPGLLTGAGGSPAADGIVAPPALVTGSWAPPQNAGVGGDGGAAGGPGVEGGPGYVVVWW
ncbi:hypothetical protein ACFYXS_26355 [Streptomyces sp. NPDC002574]|uniref:hypothetical protein n=1 Tax=Streptomyces sp. NPDC002574 TaxID=3364652 RepID=UPI0036A6BA28